MGIERHPADQRDLQPRDVVQLASAITAELSAPLATSNEPVFAQPVDDDLSLPRTSRADVRSDRLSFCLVRSRMHDAPPLPIAKLDVVIAELDPAGLSTSIDVNRMRLRDDVRFGETLASRIAEVTRWATERSVDVNGDGQLAAAMVRQGFELQPDDRIELAHQLLGRQLIQLTTEALNAASLPASENLRSCCNQVMELLDPLVKARTSPSSPEPVLIFDEEFGLAPNPSSGISAAGTAMAIAFWPTTTLANLNVVVAGQRLLIGERLLDRIPNSLKKSTTAPARPQAR